MPPGAPKPVGLHPPLSRLAPTLPRGTNQVLLAAGPRPLVALLRGAPLPAREGAQLHLYETVAARGGWVSALVAAELIEQRMGAAPEADERGAARSNAAPRGRWRRVVDVTLQSRCLLVPS